MPVTYPLSLPSNNIASLSMTLAHSDAASESPFSLQQQIVSFAGQQWRLGFSPPPMVREDAEQWISFMLALRGRLGTFLAGDPSAINPRGVGGGSPQVKGAGQTGRQLIIDGAPNTTTGWLKAGDYFQLGSGANSRLYKLVEDANTNGSGEVTLYFEPALRATPADNAPLTIVGARGVFRMQDNAPSWSVDSNKHYRVSFDAVEVF